MTCSRAFSEWKSAVREFADEETEALRRRSPEEWEALEDKTIEAIRRARIGRRRLPARWALAVAAALAFFAVALPLWRGREWTPPAAAAPQAAPLSAQDAADDALLRDVARLSRGEDDASRLWGSLAPEPASAGDERL
jgi:hypothetical protein